MFTVGIKRDQGMKWVKNIEFIYLKFVSAIFYQIFISHQIIALQKL